MRGTFTDWSIGATCWMAALFWATPCWSKPPQGVILDPAMSQWFETLQQPRTRFPCCSIADCRAVQYRQSVDGGYTVLYQGRWYRVPQGVILRGQSNPLGQAVACFETVIGWGTMPGISDDDREDRREIRCFVPPQPNS